MSRKYTCDGCGAAGYNAAESSAPNGWAWTMAGGNPMDLCGECRKALSDVYQSRLPALHAAETIALDNRRRARLGIK